jgi:folate-dependent phosphoribosylglycinamide formyltransferase PurN
MLNALENLRIGVLCSHRAPALDTLLHHPNRGRLYDIACVITSEESFNERLPIEAAGVPVLSNPIRRYHHDHDAPMRDLAARRGYDESTAEVFDRLGVNTVVLLSYLYIVTEPMLQRFDGRMLNIHDADLTLRRPDGSRRFVGLHSTRDAIVAGASETRSSVHFVEREVDAGPVLLVSDPFPVAPFVHDAVSAGAFDVVKAYAYAHREWMIRSSWGGLLVRSLEHLASCALEYEQVAVP